MEDYKKLYESALYEHNLRLEEAGLPKQEGFEHYIENIDGETILLIPSGLYKGTDNKEHLAGMGISIECGVYYTLYGFVTDNDNKFKVSEIKHPCRTGGQTGELGAIMTLTNYFNLINSATNNAVLFQVVPHINTAIHKTAKRCGFTIKGFEDEQKSMLELALDKTLTNIMEYEHGPFKDELYNSQLHLEFGGALVNLLNMNLDEEEKTYIISLLSRDEFFEYVQNVLSTKEYMGNGYKGLAGILNKVKSNLFEPLLRKLPEYEIINEIMQKYNLTPDKIDVRKNYVTRLNLSSKNINSLEEIPGLTQLMHLEDLYLFDNQIEDIDGIKHLTGLKSLNLGKNKVKNIDSVRNLKNMESLFLACNEIKDIDAIKQLTNLKDLSLGGNQIENVTAVENLTNLNILYLSRNKIKDVSPIWRLINKQTVPLHTITLEKNQISEIEVNEVELRLFYGKDWSHYISINY